jgi:hypothetical protein
MPNILFPFMMTTGVMLMFSIPGCKLFWGGLKKAFKGDKQAREDAITGVIIYLLINGFIILNGIAHGIDLFATNPYN